MAKDPAFLFYPGDWLGGTMTFSRSHKGAYMDLLMCQFNQGHMALQDIQVILGDTDFSTMWESKLKAKFKEDKDGLFYNEKLEIEILKRKNYTASRKKNLNKGGDDMGSHIDSHMVSHMDSHMENENENENIVKHKGQKNEKSKNRFSGNFKAQGEELFAQRLTRNETERNGAENSPKSP